VDCPGVVGTGEEQDVVRFAVCSAFPVRETLNEGGELGVAAGAKRSGFLAGEQDGRVVLADVRDERLDGAFGVEAEVFQAARNDLLGWQMYAASRWYSGQAARAATTTVSSADSSPSASYSATSSASRNRSARLLLVPDR
jgi:hypothetical protein